MSNQPDHKSQRPESGTERKPYEKPTLTRVELSLEETLATGCKTVDDFMCVGPPEPQFDAGT